MEDAKNSKEDGPPEPSSNGDQSVKANAVDIAMLEKTAAVNPVSSYSVIDGEIGTLAPDLCMHEDNIAELNSMNHSSPSEDGSSGGHRRNNSVDQVVGRTPNNFLNRTQSAQRLKAQDNGELNQGQIDTAAPFESVKAAVSKFGGIVDWKAHRVQTVERRKFIEQELSKAQDEIPIYKQQCEVAEEAKKQVMKELDGTRRLIEELKLNLDRAQLEEQQAKQDSELAKLRVEELEQGIADEASFAAKAQLEVAKARHAAAISEAKTVKDELVQLTKDYNLLLVEKDTTMRKAEEAVAASREIDKSVEDLTIELLTVKQSLESAHAAHLEADEHRIAAILAKEQETQNWEKELRNAEEELNILSQRMQSTKDLKLKLGKATALLQELKAELASYMNSKPHQTSREDTLNEAPSSSSSRSRADIHVAIDAAKTELAEVRKNIERTIDEVNILKVAATSLKLDLDKENTELAAVQQKEGMAAITIGSLENELNRIKSEIAEVQMKEKEERERMGDLPTRLQRAANEAEQSKQLVQQAHDELKKAREEAKQAKAEASTKESRLHAVQKEIEAAKASEKLALAAMNALEESESSQRNNMKDESQEGITLSLEEYYELSKRAHEAEEQAKSRVDAAIAQLEAAKESESRSMARLEEVTLEVSKCKESLELTVQKAEEAMEAKEAVEQELRMWKTSGQEQKETNGTSKGSHGEGKISKDSFSLTKAHAILQKLNPKMKSGSNTGVIESSPDHVAGSKKKKKSMFPRFFMFMGKKKNAHSSKTA